MIRTQLHTPSLDTRFAKHQTVGPGKKSGGSGIPILIVKNEPRREMASGVEALTLQRKRRGGAEAEPAAEDDGMVGKLPRGDADLAQARNLRFRHHQNWASLECHKVNGLRRNAIMKLGQNAAMPFHPFPICFSLS